ncbi:hypothetical protein [Streptomyces sp. S186]|uniref:hypothetical protein n=1 Tax=Streptomyces sp. S186 TaxID=3434395 RepID=UPI003F67A381
MGAATRHARNDLTNRGSTEAPKHVDEHTVAAAGRKQGTMEGVKTRATGGVVHVFS